MSPDIFHYHFSPGDAAGWCGIILKVVTLRHIFITSSFITTTGHIYGYILVDVLLLICQVTICVLCDESLCKMNVYLQSVRPATVTALHSFSLVTVVSPAAATLPDTCLYCTVQYR